MNNLNPQNACCCNKISTSTATKKSKINVVFTFFRTTFLSVLIAFFPKCPLCWAVYMSMFGSIGLSQLPYMGWLLPILMGFLGFHLIILYRKGKKNGYLPFYVSLLGAFFMLIGRTFLPESKILLFIGVICIITSSLIATFSSFQIQLLKHKTN